MTSTNIWFEGPVAEAVRQVTQKNAVFLVYIYDDSENSKLLDTTFQDEKLRAVIETKAVVALKMQKDSDNANMFSQLYTIYQVPIVYFILQGTIKDFGAQDMTSENIVTKINALYIKDTAETNTAKEKLEEIKKKRQEEEKKQEIEREIKRREDGKLAQKTKESLEEKQQKIHFEKMKKERKEAEEYKKKVKEQIEKDKREKIAARKTVEKHKVEQSNMATESQSSSSFHDHSNLNIKQLDGSSIRHKFSPYDTLVTVTQWIEISRTDGDMPFKLYTQFPSRNFDIGDEQRTLLELKLCPSATLIMKPVKNASAAYSGIAGIPAPGSSLVMDLFYSAGTAIYNAGSSVASYLVTPTAAPDHGQRLGGSGPSNSNGQSSSSSNNVSSAKKSSSSIPKSNINTLNSTFKKDDEDKKHAYNGNSVNQEQ